MVFQNQSYADADSDYQKALDAKLESYKTYYVELKKLKNPTEAQKSELRNQTIGQAESAYKTAEKKWISTHLKEFNVNVVDGKPGAVQDIDVESLVKEAKNEEKDESKEKEQSPSQKRKPSQLSPVYQSGSKLKTKNTEKSDEDSPKLDGSDVPEYMEFPGQ